MHLFVGSCSVLLIVHRVSSPRGCLFTVGCLNALVCILASQPMYSRLCTGSTPSTTQMCHIPCPVECELSPWGAWGPCTFENCDEPVIKKGKHGCNHLRYWDKITFTKSQPNYGFMSFVFFLFYLFVGFKFRRRNITNNPTGGEGSCPHLVEAVPCEDPSCFTWQLVKLEECVPEDDMDCGEGTQNPQVRCINSKGNTSSEIHNTHHLKAAL